MAKGRQVLTFDPIAQPSGSFNSQLPRGCGTIRIKNDSIVDLLFSINNFASMTTEVAPGATVDIEGQPPYSQIYWATQYKLSTNVKTLASRVSIIAYDPGEEPSPISSDLPRHFNPTNIGFSALIASPTTTGTIAANIFNPPGSGFNFTFYTADAITAGGAGAACTLNFNISTVDNALPFGLIIVNHTLGGPASVASATGSTTANSGGMTAIYTYQPLAAFTVYNLIAFPDQILAPPGSNVQVFTSGPVNSTQCIDMRWTETPI